MKKICLILATTIATIQLHALTVNTTAGNLEKAVGENITEKALEVTGEIDASDFDFIAGKMQNLETLNLRNAKIVKYEGKVLNNGRIYCNENEIPEFALLGSGIKNITLPASVISVSDAAFAGTAITSAELPENCRKIGAMAFKDCILLKSINLGGVTTVSDDTFSGCTSLTEITGTENLTVIGQRAFKGCASLENFAFSKNLIEIGKEAFAKSALKTADISKTSLTAIESGVFAECTGLTKVVLPESIERFDRSAFFGDAEISEFNFPNSLTEIGDFGLYGLSKLQYPIITDVNEVVGNHTNLSTIGKYGMADCSSMTQFSLPATTTYLGDYAMAGWTSFVDLLVRNIDTAPELGENVWYNVNQPNVYLYVTDSNESSFKDAAQWQEFNFTHSTTSAEQTIAEDLNAKIAVWFDGTVLNVTAKQEIETVTLYDTTGKMLTTVQGDSENIQIPTENWQNRLYIVRVSLSDGTVSAVKSARK